LFIFDYADDTVSTVMRMLTSVSSTCTVMTHD